MDWRKELKERLGVMDEIAAAGLDDMEGYEILGEQHLRSLKGIPPAGRDISNPVGFMINNAPANAMHTASH